MNDIEQIKNERDRRIRRQILITLRIVAGLPAIREMSGRGLMEQNEQGAADLRVEDESHLLRLLGELVAWGLIEERDDRKRKSAGGLGLSNLMYRIGGDGLALLSENRAPHAGVWDDRIVKDD